VRIGEEGQKNKEASIWYFLTIF